MPPNFVTPTDLPTALADLTNLDGRASRRGWDVKEYGALGNGIADDSAAILAAVAAANSAGGGTVYFPAGTFLTSQTITLYSNITLMGAGIGATTLKLTNGANTDLLKTDQFDALINGSTQAGPSRWALRNMSFDGNGANQANGRIGSFYGSEYIVESCHFRNGKGGGIRSKWGTGGSFIESHWANVKIYNCLAGRYLDFEGPHDSMFTNMSVFADSSITPAAGLWGIRDSGNAGGELFTNVHVWGAFEYCWFFDVGSDGTKAYNCVGEGGSTNLYMNSSQNIFHGELFGSNGGGPYSVAQGGSGETGVRLGTVSTTAVNSNMIAGHIYNWVSGDKPLLFDNDTGNDVAVVCRTGSATAAVFGTPSFKTNLRVVDPTTPGFSQSSQGLGGNGVPNSTLGVVGSFYHRWDGTVGSNLYKKTGASTWTAIL